MTFEIPAALQEKLRNLPAGKPNELVQVGEDIWYIDGDLEQHTDSTEVGKHTVLVVLLNDGNSKFKHGDCILDMLVGEGIEFDARIQHSVMQLCPGRLAMLIWDVPIKEAFVTDQLKYRLFELRNL